MSEIKVDTVAEKTSANGVTVDGLNIKDSKLVTANSVITSNVTDANITLAKLAGDSVDGTKIADNAINSEHYTDASIDAAHLNADVITGHTAETSIADADTILIHDASASALRKMTKANFVSGIGGTNTPAFNIDLNATQNVSSLTNTKVALNTARVDTDSGFDSSNNRWVVPSGKGGTYYVGFELNGASAQGSTMLQFLSCSLKINGSAYIGTNIDFRSNPARECKVNANFIIALNAGDYLEIFGNNYVVSGQAYFGGGNSNAERNKSHLYGYRLIT